MRPVRRTVLAFIALVLTACEPGGELTPPPAAPQASAVTSDGGVHLSWGSSEGAEHYRVYVYTYGELTASSPLGVYDVADSSLTLNGLENGRLYQISVTALGEGGESEAFTLSVIPQSRPAAPQNIEVSNGSGIVTLAWQDVPGASEYNVYIVPAQELPSDREVRQAPSLFVRERIVGPAHTEAGLANGTEYAFFVTAVNTSGESELSARITATPAPYRNLTAGSAHTCVIDDADALWCWGSNTSDQLGGLGATASNKPVKVVEDTQWKIAALGWDQTCAVSREDSLVCWGAGSSGPTVITVGSLPPNAGGTSGGGSVDPPSSTGATWRQLAVATNSACGTGSDGSLWCWGIGGVVFPQEPLRRIGFSMDWLAVSNNDWNKCAIKQDRSLWCWGDNYIGQIGDGTREAKRSPTAVMPNERWTVLTESLGVALPSNNYYPQGPGILGTVSHACAITDDARLMCWGVNLSGQLGNDTFTESLVPTEVSGAGKWRAVDAGKEHTCGIQTDGSLWCWGSNQFGQLGIEGSDDRVTPTRVSDDVTWSSVAAGESHTCASRRDGSIWCAGRNDLGQLGTGDSPARSEPRQVLTEVIAVAATDSETCATRQDGSLWCWGSQGSRTDARSLLGTEYHFIKPRLRRQPVQVELPTGLKASTLSVFNADGPFGASALCVLDRQGMVWCQDREPDSQAALSFAQVRANEPWERLALGDRYSCGIREGGALYCWVKDVYPVYPGYGKISGYTPQYLGGASAWTEVTVGYEHGCAVNVASELWCWGRNGSGQLGVDVTITPDTATPVQVLPDATWQSVSAGFAHTCAIARGNTLYCWGYNDNGQLGIGGPNAANFLPQQVGDVGEWSDVSAGNISTCAVNTDSTLWCWGQFEDSNKIRATPTQIGTQTGWASVVNGGRRSCATKTDGRLYCWGGNEYGQVGDGSAWSTSWRRVNFDAN